MGGFRALLKESAGRSTERHGFHARRSAVLLGPVRRVEDLAVAPDLGDREAIDAGENTSGLIERTFGQRAGLGEPPVRGSEDPRRTSADIDRREPSRVATSGTWMTTP